MDTSSFASPTFRSVFSLVQRVAAIALTLLMGSLLMGTLPTFFGYETFVVLSGSMEPAMHVGDLAVVGSARPNTLMVGDVITYRTTQRPDLVVTHRLTAVSLDDKGMMAFSTKGDANNTGDSVTVSPDAVLGRVVYTLPKLGFLIEFSKRPEGKALLIGLPGLLLGLDVLRGLRKRSEAAAPAQAQGPQRTAGGTVQPIRGEAGEYVARGRVALLNGAPGAALMLFDQAIATNPFLDEPWLMKAQCLGDYNEAMACLRAGLTVNPGSAKLQEAVDRMRNARSANG
ncbi:MAG: signal peptidase I [Chloroflexi bacterium]|nr:signal peptidase I [Chloroflexota bacterium]